MSCYSIISFPSETPPARAGGWPAMSHLLVSLGWYHPASAWTFVRYRLPIHRNHFIIRCITIRCGRRQLHRPCHIQWKLLCPHLSCRRYRRPWRVTFITLHHSAVSLHILLVICICLWATHSRAFVVLPHMPSQSYSWRHQSEMKTWNCRSRWRPMYSNMMWTR
jgi:hypothetical protein